ncbi:MAG: outer membrane beta-barrel protein [Flavobacteriales bacterium]|nr:outer membrane beta-barrel protein [Flavobacteriales bacterium]
MQKLLLLFLVAILISSGSVLGQGIQAGVKGSINSTWLFNNHVSDAAGISQGYVPSFGQSYGLSGAIFFSKKLGVEMNFFYDTHRQKYSNDDESFESETTLNRVSIPLMLKLKSTTGAYLEIGAIYNALTKAEFSFAVDSLALPIRDVKPSMAKSSVDAMLGIGVDINLFAGLSLTTALRFWGSLTDLKGIDSFGGDLSDELYLTAVYDGEYQETRGASAGFVVGLVYSIGKIAGE